MASKLTIHSMQTEDIDSYLLERMHKTMASTAKNPFIIGIPGGRSAAHIIKAAENLSDKELSRTFFILVDERLSGKSNYQTLLDYGLQHLITSGRVKQEQAASPGDFKNQQLPELDLLILGVGEDGHFASLFPGSYPILDTPDTPDIVTINNSPKPPPERITISYRGFRRTAAKADVLLIMRFHNDIIRGIWNNHFIDNIQIIFDESLGVDQRLGFYEKIGVVRDTVQNHILQIITHLTMSEPSSFTPEEISHEKIRVLRSIKPVEQFTLSRYESLAEKQKDSIRTPTFATFKLYVDTFEFSGVPIYVRTGKMQKISKSKIFVNFKNSMGRVLNSKDIEQNSVIITTHPEMDIDITLNMKEPNTKWKTKPVRFNFNHAKTFGINTPEAYEQIVEKILQSDKSLFPFISEIREAWRIVTPMLSGNPVETYPDYTLPKSAQALIQRDGHSWNA
jgi:6-phosphogluconolactonase/glucosamine-6-phosphate isomerase/deaminase